jgi:inner membrane protein
MVSLWCWRQFEHDAALQLASIANYGPLTQSELPQVQRVFLSPYPINPYRWHAIVDTPAFYQLATVDLRTGTVDTSPARDIFYKPPSTLATLAAKRSWLGQVYLDWSSFPLVTDTGLVTGTNNDTGDTGLTAVTFRDLRFMYDVAFLRGRREPPLSGTAYVDVNRHIVRMEMDGHVQK